MWLLRQRKTTQSGPNIMLNIATTTALSSSGNQGQRAVAAAPAESAAAPEPTSAAVATPDARQPSAEELKRISDELQKRVNEVAPELRFSVDQNSGRTVIQITDQTTKKVIRQIPSEEALQISEDMDRFQKGLLVNRQA
jgi:flagellar protein FlaG